MPDRENVIKGLEEAEIMLIQAVDRGGEMAVMGAFKCLNRVTDAISLLKEQEAVEPTLRHGGDGIFVWACGSCGAYMYHINAGSDKAKEYAKYCRQCGRKVKWE